MKAIVKKKMLPELRFDEFQKEYRILKFNNIVKLRKKKIDPIKSNDSFKSVELESIEKETGLLVKTFDSENLKSLKTKFHKGDILFGKLRPYLRKFYFCEFEGICTSEIWAFYSNSECNKYVYYLIQTSKFNYQVNITTGTRMPRADWNQISTTKFRIPSFKEQQKIANFLTAIDQRITLLKEKKAALEDYKKGLMQKIFSQEVRFKDGEGNDFPDWEENRLVEICDVKGGKRIPKGYSLENKNNGFPYITVSNMLNGTVSLKDIKFVPKEAFPKIKNYRIFTNEIYISVAGTLGLVGVIPKELNGANLTENANKLTNIKCNQKYLYHYLNSNYFKKLIWSVRTTNAQPKLAIYALKSFVVKLPKKQEQQKIANFLSTIDQNINTMKKQIADSELFKKGLLQRMFV
ncbi:restriction endonuclease subunit S [Marinicella gelatinilytica]|uniref:restriction endonuclease subunit S n=1 Tax=Marinicella gelatinilytica TaxID=2996017 RepID=UPI002260E070|nr:restriction endonuclease subunit S [Marinicella gelatinilytica]MCX7546295.1 restriction endonuclease subunit S [Marinicella gelatinilytica]